MNPSEASFASRDAYPTVPSGSRITTQRADHQRDRRRQPGGGLDRAPLDEAAPDPPEARDRDRGQEPRRRRARFGGASASARRRPGIASLSRSSEKAHSSSSSTPLSA